MKPIAHIDSRRIGIPGLTGLLKTLGEVCGKHEIPFFLIGALARNLLLEHVHGVIPTRLTMDVDIAVAVTDWGHYETLSNELIDRYGYVRGRESHRFRSPENTLLDLVPYGEIESTEQRTARSSSIISPSNPSALWTCGMGKRRSDLFRQNRNRRWSTTFSPPANY